ncbi:Nn.00g062650.m01.CDS01 [Neocucurbitaria sp. VM-36]
MAARRRQAEQTAASGTSTLPQPTTTLGLSTTFTPAASCAANKLTILPPPGYLIWANEPVPVPGTTVTNCYPSEFLKSYTSVSSGDVGSSIVPVMSPLVCPSNFCTRYLGDENYIACCPSGYLFAAPSTPLIRDRPAYGGTCYSDFTVSQTVTALKYDDAGNTNLEPWAATSSGAQAYAHPIDGFANSFPTLGCAAPSSSSSLASSSSNTTAQSSLASSASSPSAVADTAHSSASSASPGTIAGAVVGSVLGLAVIIGLVFFLLRRRNHHRSDSAQKIHQLDDESVENSKEKATGAAAAEIGSSGQSDKYGQLASGTNFGQEIYEMNAQPVHELPSWSKSQGHQTSLSDQK